MIFKNIVRILEIYMHYSKFSCKSHVLKITHTHIHPCTNTRPHSHDIDLAYIYIRKWVEISYYEVISAVDDVFGQWDANIATLMEEMFGAQGCLCWKMNFIWPHSMRVPWSAWEFSSDPSIDINIHGGWEEQRWSRWCSNSGLDCL